MKYRLRSGGVDGAIETRRLARHFQLNEPDAPIELNDAIQHGLGTCPTGEMVGLILRALSRPD